MIQRFEWLQTTRAGDGTTGNAPRVEASQGYLWGELELTSATETDGFGAVRNVVTGVVTLNQFPPVGVQDLLRDEAFGDVYRVTGVRRGANVLICEVEHFGGLDD